MQTVSKIVQDRGIHSLSSNYAKTMCINCEGGISAIALNKDASQVVVGGRTVFKIYHIDEDSFEEKCNLRVGKINLNYCATDIAWNHTEDHILATGATNGAVVIWDLNRLKSCKQEHLFTEHKRTVNRVCFHENEHRLLLSASQDGTMKLFDIRKKGMTNTFTAGSSSVRDIQFSPCNLNYFAFASADEGGNVHIWDMRRPDKVEKQFTAHSGPVFAIDWHGEDKNLFATAGRDKMIKIWDLHKGKAIHTIYSIASVARIRWRPNRRYHIATCSLLVDCSINIWDVRRPYVPFATFDRHKDVATSIVFKNKDPHVLLSGSKDSYLYQYVFRDAKRPGEHLVPSGLDISVHGIVGHAHSDKQGKLSDSPSSGGWSSYLPTKPSKSMERNDHFVDVSSYLQVFKNKEDKLKNNVSLSGLMECAMRYKLCGQAPKELCHHNARVAQNLQRVQVAQSWLLLLTLYSSHLVDKQSHQHTTTSTLSSSKDHIVKGKQMSDIKPDTDLDGTSENSDDNDDKDMFDGKLSCIASGQIAQDWDMVFGDGEPGSYSLQDRDSRCDGKQAWILPNEAFQPRHEIQDREAPLEPLQTGPGDTQIQSTTVETDISSIPNSWTGAPITNNIITTDMQHIHTPEWSPIQTLLDMLKHFAEQGDVQTPVCMLIVMNQKIASFVDIDLQEDWFLSYIEILGRFKLWSIANSIVKLSNLPQVSMLNQRSTTIHVNCNMCNRPLQRTAWLCDRCKQITNKCDICHLPVKGVFLWCQGCSHGGHIQHVKDWFSRNTECPTGCGHMCEYT